MNNKTPKTVEELDNEMKEQLRRDMSDTINNIYDELVVDKKIMFYLKIYLFMNFFLSSTELLKIKN